MIAWAVSGWALGAPAPAAGQSDTTDSVTILEPVTIAAVRERVEAPPVLTLSVTARELRRAQASNPWDLARRVAGIEIHEQGQGPGFASDAVLRGFTSDHSSDVLLVVDGVPINLPVHGHVEGYADWNTLLTAGISTLRVLHGPASPLYGDFALGGVVEVTTAADATPPGAGVSASSYGDAHAWARTGTRGESGGWMAAGEGVRQQGWREHAAYSLGNGLFRGWTRAGPGRLEGGVAVYGSRWDSPGFVSVARYNARDLEAAHDLTDGGDARRVVAHGRYTAAMGATGVQLLGWSQALRSRVFLNIPEHGTLRQSEELDERVAVGGRAELAWTGALGDVTIGASGRADATAYDLYGTTARVRDSLDVAFDGSYVAGGAYARWRRALTGRLGLDAGMRVDALRYGSRDRLATGGAWRHETAWIASPKLGARYLLGGRMALLASVSRGFRGAPGVIGDPGRAPLVAWAKEVGIAYEHGDLRAHVAAFRTDVGNERIQNPVTREISDAGQSRRQGISVDAEVPLGAGARLTIDATLNDARVTGSAPDTTATPLVIMAARAAGSLQPAFHLEPLEPGARVPGVARYFGRASLEARTGRGVEVRVTSRVGGPFTPIGEPDIRTQPYAVLDLGTSVELRGLGAVLDLELQNVLDTRYPELRASGYLNPGAPRTLRAAFRFERSPS